LVKIFKIEKEKRKYFRERKGVNNISLVFVFQFLIVICCN